MHGDELVRSALAPSVSGSAAGLPSATDGEGETTRQSVSEAMLRAVAAMARISKRQQAELGVALTRAGLVLGSGPQQMALRYLCETFAVEDVIPLDDGGILLSVTAAGMERALR